MTIPAGRHYPKNLLRCSDRPPERYGDVALSVQASQFHASDLRNGCGHTPLEPADRVEVAPDPETPQAGIGDQCDRSDAIQNSRATMATMTKMLSPGDMTTPPAAS